MWFDTDKLREFERDLESISNSLRDAANKGNTWVQRELAKGAMKIREEAIKSMRETPKTGRAYKRPGGKIHIASSPYNPPAIDYGDLVRSITFDVRPMEVEIGSTTAAPHGYWMEKGTGGLAMGSGKVVEPRPWLVPAVNKNINEIVSKIGEVTVELIENPFRGVASRSTLR